MGKKAFTEKDGVFHLIEDTPDNRTKLNNRITEIIQNEGNKKSIKSITYGPNKKPYRISTNSIKDLLAGKTDNVKITTVNVNRPEAEIRPGAKVREGSKAFERTDELTKAFEKRISGIENHTPQRLERYYSELNKEIRELHLFVAKRNKELKAAGADESQLVSRGHYSRLSKSVDSPRNLWLELMVPNKAKGNRYSPNQGAMRAIGNPIKEGIDPVENWTRDYVTWLDRPENGGSGILPQRGDYSPLMEQKFNLITGEQWETLSAKDKLKANDVINDLVRDQEKLNQFLPSEGAELRKWGRLTPDQYEQGLGWINDRDYRKTIGKPIAETTELGGPLGGVRSTIKTNINPKRLLTSTYRAVAPVAEPVLKTIPYVSLGLAVEGMRSGITKAAEDPTLENVAYATGKTAALGLEIDPTGITPTIVDTATETFFTPEGRKNWRGLSAKYDFSTL